MSIDFTVKVEIPQIIIDKIGIENQDFQTKLHEAVKKSTYSDLYHGNTIIAEFEDYATAIHSESALNAMIDHFMSTLNPLLTQEDYLLNHGENCPKCNSTDLNKNQNVEIDFDTIYQECNCNQCGAKWTDTYKLINYSNLNQ